MNILHIGKYFAPFRGGVETYLYDVMRAQAAMGDRCLALVHNHDRSARQVTEQFDPAGASWTVWRSATWGKAFFTPLSPAFRNDLMDAIETFKPDVIHAHLPNPSVCWLLTRASFEGTPLVLHWHSDVLTDNQGVAMRALYRFYRPLERMLLERAAAIIATSSSYLQTSESLKDYPEKCHVVPLGLDGARVLSHAPEEQPDRPNDEPFELLAIGRLTYYKGFGFLLRALAELENVRLHIVGTGVLWKELHAIARELKVKRYVTFHGGLDDEALAGRLARCDCVCLPSTERTEAFGLVLLEAMAFGKPTIATRVQGSGMSWVVRDGETGLLVPPRDVQALADAIRTLQNDPERCARLGESGRTRFEQHFAIGPSVDALRTVYERVTTPAVRQ